MSAAGQQPSLARIVHFAADNGEDERAAIITAVHPEIEGMVNLTIFQPVGPPLSRSNVEYSNPSTDGADDGTPVPGTWHWPERV